MIEAYKKFWNNYSDFKGRSTRPDYWWVVLANLLVVLPFYILLWIRLFSSLLVLFPYMAEDGSYTVSDEVIGAAFLQEFLSPFNIFILLLVIVYGLATFIPYLAITVRRLRDAGFHWAFIFVNLVPYVGGLILIVLLIQKTKVDNNGEIETDYHSE